MGQETIFFQSFQIKGGDFLNAGSVSVKVKSILKEIGVKQEIVYRTSICCYEAEMNTIMYANKGILEFSVTPEEIIVVLKDEGHGIQNLELAMQEGYSTATEEMREMGFGAGMGLPNIKKNSDAFHIESEVNKGTKVYFKINLN